MGEPWKACVKIDGSARPETSADTHLVNASSGPGYVGSQFLRARFPSLPMAQWGDSPFLGGIHYGGPFTEEQYGSRYSCRFSRRFSS
jgi:hypothetical protein